MWRNQITTLLVVRISASPRRKRGFNQESEPAGGIESKKQKVAIARPSPPSLPLSPCPHLG